MSDETSMESANAETCNRNGNQALGAEKLTEVIEPHSCDPEAC
jgi:hypothetical protein